MYRAILNVLFQFHSLLVDSSVNYLQASFEMDTTAVPVKRACVAMLKTAVRQQRHRLKKQYFTPYPLHLVSKTSPIDFMTNVQWLQLVEYWKDEDKMVSYWRVLII